MFKGITVNSACYAGYPVETALRSIAEAGYQYVELAAMRGWCEHVSPNMDADALAHVQSLLKSLRLTVSALSAHVDYLASEDAFAWLADCIPLAKRLGADIVITSPGEGAYQDRLSALKRLDALCGAADVTLALEPHGSLCSGSLLKQAIADANVSRVRINFDTANVLYFGGYDPLTDLENSVTDIGYIHLKDQRGGKGVWDFPALGEGNLPMDGIVDRLAQTGYEGFLSVEVEFTPDGPGSFAEIERSITVSRENLAKLTEKHVR